MKKIALKKNEILLTNKAWVPINLLSMSKVKKNYIRYMYEEQACAVCDYYNDRLDGVPYYTCETCAAFKGKYKLYSKKTMGGIDYIGLPLGDKLNFVKKTGIPPGAFEKVVDNRSKPKLGYDISFVGKLRKYQKDARKQWLAFKYGQLMAPPRSGKTILAVKLTLDLGRKTLILVHQGDLLTQMLNSFYEFTDIKDLEFSEKTTLIGIAKKPEDFKKWPIVLSNYQKFITPRGKKRLKRIVRKFGFVIVDEVHRGNSDCFSQVLSTLECKYKLGLTATPKRKDKREFLVEHIVGPVTASVAPQQVQPRLFVHTTGVVPKREYKVWVYAMQFLAKDKMRQKMIVDMAVKDVLAGHHVVIPVVFVKQANDIADAISKKLLKKLGKPNLALAFTAKLKDRESYLNKIRAGKIKVTVGIRSLIQAGINVPRWSALYEISPISNYPNHTQEVARVRTPAPELNKPQPIIRHFIDENMGMTIGCFKTCFQVYKTFEMDEPTKEVVYKFMKQGKPRRWDEDKDYIPERIIEPISVNNKSEKSKGERGFGFSGLNAKLTLR